MFRASQRILLGKIEVTYGTDPVPTVAANAIKARNIKVNYVGDVLESNEESMYLSPLAPQLGKRYMEISFECDVKGSGALGTAPEVGDLLRACGFSETVSAGSSVTYAPASTSLGSVTLYVYDIADSGNSRLHKAVGAIGTVNFKIEAGQKMVAEFRFMAKYTAMTDVTAPTAPTYDATLAPVVRSCAFALNSVTTLVADSLNVDMANNISERQDVNDATSIAGFTITGRKPNGAVKVEAVLAATYDFRADWIAATQRALTIDVGATSGNRIALDAPKVSIDAINDEESNGIRKEGLPFHLSANSGNDEVVIVFT